MMTISLREFMLHGSAMLKDLPLVLTVRGTPVCSVIPFSDIQSEQPKQTVSTVVSTDAPATQAQILKESQMPQNRIPCNFCPNRGATRHTYQFEDGSGEAEAYFCPLCWDKYTHGKEIKSDVSQMRVRLPSETKPIEFRGSFPKPVKKKKNERK